MTTTKNPLIAINSTYNIKTRCFMNMVLKSIPFMAIKTFFYSKRKKKQYKDMIDYNFSDKNESTNSNLSDFSRELSFVSKVGTNSKNGLEELKKI